MDIKHKDGYHIKGNDSVILKFFFSINTREEAFENGKCLLMPITKKYVIRQEIYYVGNTFSSNLIQKHPLKQYYSFNLTHLLRSDDDRLNKITVYKNLKFIEVLGDKNSSSV